jgi:LCP family protein required for cell wall assembly
VIAPAQVDDPSPTGRGRPPAGLGRMLGSAVAATVLPGLGHLLLGRRRTGAALVTIFLLGAGASAVAAARLGRSGLLQSLVSPAALFGVTVGCVSGAVLWAGVVVWTYLLGRPRRLTTAKQLVGAAVVAILCASVAVPLGMVARLADTQRGLLNAVFSAGPAAAPGPADAAGHIAASTSGGFGRPRWNVLLLGSDAGPDRTGARTDTMMVASIDTRTAATTLIGLPRNIQYAPFPPGSPMAARFHDPRSPTSGDYLLNNVAQYGAEHPDLAPAGPTADRGLNLLLSSVSYMLALPLDHYVEVDMNGLAAIVDALGGVTVDVGPEPLPIGGVTYDGRHVRPDGYVPPGVQHLDGNQALWFARSRRNSDDYDRMARQRCLIGAVLAQKQPIDVVTRFRSVATATASSIRTDIPQSLLPALLTLADEHRPPLLRSISFDPGLPDPAAPSGRFDPAHPDVPFMRRTVAAATAGAGATVPPPVTGSRPPATPTPAAPAGAPSVAPRCTGT